MAFQDLLLDPGTGDPEERACAGIEVFASASTLFLAVPRSRFALVLVVVMRGRFRDGLSLKAPKPARSSFSSCYPSRGERAGATSQGALTFGEGRVKDFLPLLLFSLSINISLSLSLSPPLCSQSLALSFPPSWCAGELARSYPVIKGGRAAKLPTRWRWRRRRPLLRKAGCRPSRAGGSFGISFCCWLGRGAWGSCKGGEGRLGFVTRSG